MRRRSPRRLFLGAAAVASLALLLGGAQAASTAVYNLTGKWQTPGTHLTLTQTGRTLTWIGGPDNKAWIQTFKGAIVTDAEGGQGFRGEFWQDEPGHLPPRYHGTMKARIDDSCHFTFLSIVQEGQPTIGTSSSS